MKDQAQKTWIDEMIERESIPQGARVETVEQFAARHNISVATYYYQSYKEENQKQILELSLNTAKKVVPEILQVLIDNAKKGREKSIEMYLDYVLKIAKNLDIKSDGKALGDTLTEKHKQVLDALLYDEQKGAGKSNKRHTGRKKVSM